MKRGKPFLLVAIILCAMVLQVGTVIGQSNTGDPELPRQQVDTTYPTTTGTTYWVYPGNDLQAYIDAVNPGDTIMLQPGGIYWAPNGGFRLKYKPGNSTQWIIIRSWSPAFNSNGMLPPGTRVNGTNSTHSGEMPKIYSQVNNSPAISVEPGAHHYRIVGLELTFAPGVGQSTDATVQLGSRFETNAAMQPSNIIVDRCYVHGKNGDRYVRGVDLEGKYMAVIDSYISQYQCTDCDSQAIFGSNSAGPFAIYNNHLEAAGENIMFGGDDPRIANMVPADIEIKRNLFTKNLSWRGSYSVKNLFELKNARRVLFDGNLLEKFWSGGGQDYAVNIKSTNQGGACSWCVSEDVTISNNKIRDVANGFDIGAKDGAGPSQTVTRVKIYNNLLYNLLPQWGGPYGKQFRIRGGASYVKIIHNTAEGSANTITVGDNFEVNPNLTLKDNIFERGAYGIKANSEGTSTLSYNFGPLTDTSYQRNLLVNTSDEPTNPSPDQSFSDETILWWYPRPAPAPNNATSGDTFVASSWNHVGFVNRPGGNYRLASGSIYKGRGSDGRDLGVDQDAIDSAIEGTVRFSASAYTVNEGVANTAQGFGTLPVQVVRTGDTFTPATVKYFTSDQSGGNECNLVTGYASQRCDYAQTAGTLRFEPGQSSKTIYIPITNDGYVEGNEVFTIELQNNVGASLGKSTITIVENDSTPTTGAQNPYLSPYFFVRQLYLDILGREADTDGFNGWTGVLINCPEQGFLGAPPQCDRPQVAHGFIASPEFTDRGYLIYRMYEVGLDRLPRYNEFMPDMAAMSGQPNTVELEQNTAQFIEGFTARQEFITKYADEWATTDAAQLIYKWEQNAGVTLPASTTTLPGQPPQYGRQELINKRQSGEFSVGQTLKAFVQQKVVYDKFFSEGYVTMLYFGFLRRDPDLNDPQLVGWNTWVDVFRNGGASRGRPDIQPWDYHHLIFGFIYSEEYRKRFGTP